MIVEYWLKAARNYERAARDFWRRADTPGNKFHLVDERVARQFEEKADDCYAAAAAHRPKRALVL